MTCRRPSRLLTSQALRGLPVSLGKLLHLLQPVLSQTQNLRLLVRGEVQSILPAQACCMGICLRLMIAQVHLHTQQPCTAAAVLACQQGISIQPAPALLSVLGLSNDGARFETSACCYKAQNCGRLDWTEAVRWSSTKTGWQRYISAWLLR